MNIKLCVNKFYIFLVFLLSSFSALSQNFAVSGKVTDDAGNILEGVTVTEKGKKTSVITSPEGAFTINVASGNAKLLFSFGSNRVKQTLFLE